MTTRATTTVDAHEVRVTRAQHLPIHLGAALDARPSATGTSAWLRVFLDEDAGPVLAATLAVLRRRPEAELRDRIGELVGYGLRLAGGTV
ncbi:hypothetical protein [Streptomyces sp. NPDC001927]